MGSPGKGRKKWDQAPSAKGAPSKQVGPREGQAKTLSARSAGASYGVKRVPYLNPDAFSRFIGPKNWGQALINDELTTCLLDNGAQLPLPMLWRGVWTLCPWTDWLKRLGDSSPLSRVWVVAWWSLSGSS